MLRHLPAITDPNVLVGPETSDDAAIYKLGEEQALVVTMDYFTPIVDDPYSFGMIAAANSLSDIYAMGARPLIMLNTVGFPKGTLPLSILGEMMRGGADKAREAGVDIVGGHTIDDPEPKFGFVVVGLVHPSGVYRNSTAQVGDVLILTKPLGTGIISTAVKREKALPEVIEDAIAVMATLNHAACDAMVEVGANACTDVTGFGLLGHLYEMTGGSRVGARVTFSDIPLLPSVKELAQAGMVPGGTHRNHEYLIDHIEWAPELSDEDQLILCDAQTSGGLLISVPQEKADLLGQALAARRVPWAQVGEIIHDPGGRIWVGR